MRDFAVSADLDIPAHVFLLERDSVAFRCLLGQALDLGSLEFEKEVSEDGVVTVWQTTYPRFDKYVPNGVVKLAQKLVGNKLVYTDILTYDSKKLQTPPFEIGVTSIAPVFQDKTTLKSRLIIESLGPHRCRQTLEGSIDVRVLGLGRTAESIIVQQLTKVYKSIPTLVHRWLQLRQTMVEREGTVWLLLGRPDTRVDWMLQEYKNYQKGKLPGGMPESNNKENLGNLELSEQHVMQKAQAQLRHEAGGLKKLPTDQQVRPLSQTPETLTHSAGAAPAAATLLKADHQRTHGDTAASTLQGNDKGINRNATMGSFQRDASPVHDDVATMVARDSSSSFVVPDRATSAELANAEEPMPWHQDTQKEIQRCNSVYPVSEHQADGYAASDHPHVAASYPKLAADGRDGVAGGQIVRPSKKQRPNKFIQCISCGAA